MKNGQKWSVDRGYRQEMIARFPRLQNTSCMPLMRLINYIMSTTNRDKRGYAIVSLQKLMEFDGLDPVETHRKTFSRDWITWAKGIIPGLRFTGYGSSVGPRCCVSIGFRPQTEKERTSDDQVDWMTGKKVSEVLQKEETIAITSVFIAQDELLKYLNRPRSEIKHAWARAKKRLKEPETFALLEQIEHPKWKAVADASLNTLLYNIVPIYEPSDTGKTHRIFTSNNNWSWTKRELREHIMQDQVQCDLKMAHLAIAASDWGTAETMTILCHSDPWGEICRLFMIGEKDICKRLIYTVVYGGGKGQLWKTLRDEGYTARESTNIVEHVIRVPFMRELLEKRTAKLEQIRSDKGIRDAFGHWHHLLDRDLKSLLATRAQSLELALLLPALNVVRGRDAHARITLWLHDGFYLWTRNAAQGPKDAAKMKSLVDAEARRRGIPTYLEVKVN